MGSDVTNAGIEPDPIPVFLSIEKITTSGCDQTLKIYYEPALDEVVANLYNLAIMPVITYKVVTSLYSLAIMPVFYFGCNKLI